MDAARRQVPIAAANNAAAPFVKHAADNPIPPGRGSLVGRTALERKTVHLSDCLADPEYVALDYQRIGQYRTILGVPLLREGVPIGVIGPMHHIVGLARKSAHQAADIGRGAANVNDDGVVEPRQEGRPPQRVGRFISAQPFPPSKRAMGGA